MHTWSFKHNRRQRLRPRSAVAEKRRDLLYSVFLASDLEKCTTVVYRGA
jgi:hypothetical protein